MYLGWVGRSLELSRGLAITSVVVAGAMLLAAVKSCTRWRSAADAWDPCVEPVGLHQAEAAEPRAWSVRVAAWVSVWCGSVQYTVPGQ